MKDRSKYLETGKSTKLSTVLICCVIGIYSLALLFYALHFGGNGFSNKTDAWGQFGDFLGGVVNPTIGIITVLFLAITLKQSESFHKEQLSHSERARDFDICMSLLSFYERSGNELIEKGLKVRETNELGLKTALSTLSDSGEDKVVYETLQRQKQEMEERYRTTTAKAQQFFDLSNELKVMLEQAHLELRGKYLK